MKREALIYRNGVLAGTLTEDGGEYRFCYDPQYIVRPDAQPVSLTLPLRSEPYVSPVLFPFFDGLIPEGWLLDVAVRNTDISILDRMSLLLLCCKDCIGSISVIPKDEQDKASLGGSDIDSCTTATADRSLPHTCPSDSDSSDSGRAKCLYCYGELEDGQKDFHPRCARKFFGTPEVPLMEYRHEDLDRLAREIIRAQTSLTGVQPKLSLNLTKHDDTARLTIVGLWGDYIFKPQTASYPQLPENEDLTMHLAEAAKMSVVPHSLIRLADGRLGYITRRIDRTSHGEKLDMEDMCQLTLHPTEYKYKGSHEQIAKTLACYSATPKLDLANYMQVLLFCFITGNNDMHLKNFSLYRPAEAYRLSPAYDLLNVTLANPADREEFALPLSGRKSKLRLEDFLAAATTMGLEHKVVHGLIEGFRKALPKWQTLIRASFLSEDRKEAYEALILSRLARLSE